jgi:hypothetical protein
MTGQKTQQSFSAVGLTIRRVLVPMLVARSLLLVMMSGCSSLGRRVEILEGKFHHGDAFVSCNFYAIVY